MYVLTHNDQVLLGPIQWNSRMFNSTIEDDTGVITKILPSDFSKAPMDLGNGLMIRAATEVRPAHNQKIKSLGGPFWTFTATAGTATYTVIDKSIPLVRLELKAAAAQERWAIESKGTTAVVQTKTVTVDTARGARDVFVQQFLLMDVAAVSRWKFPEGWMDVTKADLGICVGAGVAHVQAAFTKEATLGASIDAALTLADLDAIVIVELVPKPGVV